MHATHTYAIHVHTCIYTCTHMYICMCVYTCTHMYIYIRIHNHLLTGHTHIMHVHLHSYKWICAPHLHTHLVSFPGPHTCTWVESGNEVSTHYTHVYEPKCILYIGCLCTTPMYVPLVILQLRLRQTPYCVWALRRKKGWNKERWVGSPQGAVHMATARLGCKRTMVGTGRVNSHPGCTNRLRDATLSLWGSFLAGKAVCVLNGPRMLIIAWIVNEWVWLKSRVCLLWLEVHFVLVRAQTEIKYGALKGKTCVYVVSSEGTKIFINLINRKMKKCGL